MENQVYIFDTTLRDGQQCPGAGMSFEDNLNYAKLVAELKVDVVEAGFPSASKLDFEIVKSISEMYAGMDSSPTIAGLCQLRSEQVDKTIIALEAANKVGRARLHTYVPVAEELMQASLGGKADKGQIKKDVFTFVKRAVDAGLEVEFSPEAYSQCETNFDFVTDLIRAAVEGGARVINCPDTLGASCTLQKEEYFVNKLNKHAEIIKTEYPDSNIIWSAHCHNDFGLAVQNSINTVFDGPCRQIEGCFNGVGERAGNAALESVIMIIKHFSKEGIHTNIETSKIQEVCDFVSNNMLPRQPHWPVSGDNAAKHSSGGHTNAIIKNPLAYQPFDPREIGKEISFLFGPLSGGNHAKSIIEKAGYKCEESEKADLAQFIKEHYKERRKGITDKELIQGYYIYRSPIVTDSINYSRSSKKSEIELEGQFFDSSTGVKSVYEGKDSALSALKLEVDKYFDVTIENHRSESKGSGHDAVSMHRILVKTKDNEVYEGIGEDNDIELAALKSFIDAVNKAYIEQNYKLG